MQPEDAPAFAALVQDHPLFAPYGLTAERLAASLAKALTQCDGLLAARVEGQPAGFAWFLERGAFGRSAYLRLLVVAAAVAGKGVGTALMDAVEAEVFQRGADLFLLVNQTNADAQAFYERRGYVRVGELRDYVAPGLHELLYRKRAARCR